jgi:hypothetical protein
MSGTDVTSTPSAADASAVADRYMAEVKSIVVA